MPPARIPPPARPLPYSNPSRWLPALLITDLLYLVNFFSELPQTVLTSIRTYIEEFPSSCSAGNPDEQATDGSKEYSSDIACHKSG